MREPALEGKEVGRLLLAACAIAFVAWLVPQAVAWLFDGTFPVVPLRDALVGTVHLIHDGRWTDPASAYPRAAHAHMPATEGWWLAAAMTLTVLGASAAATWQALDRLTATSRLGRRPYDIRGRRSRSWARPRDLPTLMRWARRGDGFSLGKLDGRRLPTHPEAHVAVIAPTRSGKTTRCVIPWLLEHEGPAIVTSTKVDVVHATRAWRERLGRVVVWDPFTEGSVGWTPLAGCQDWSYALRQARWLADATQH